MNAINRCIYGCGTCSMYENGDCGIGCLPENSTGCAYADGNEITSTDPIIMTCCQYGCTMTASDYMRWNGKCAYMNMWEDNALWEDEEDD